MTIIHHPTCLDVDVYHRLCDHAASVFPREACGLLFGWRRHMTHAVALPNIAPEPHTTYLLDGRTVTQTLRQQYRLQYEWLAVYHSHPQGQPTLSPADLSTAVGFPGVWQLLITPPDICRLFSVIPSAVAEIPLTITQGDAPCS